MKYRNDTGAEWRRSGSEVIAVGATFDATAREHERFQRRRTLGMTRLGAATVLDAEDAWPLKLSPSRYLELYPEGKHAERAEALVAAGKGGEDEEDEDADNADDEDNEDNEDNADEDDEDEENA